MFWMMLPEPCIDGIDGGAGIVDSPARCLNLQLAFAYTTLRAAGSAYSPRLSDRFGGLAFFLGLPILSDWEPLHYYRNKHDNAGKQLQRSREQSQIGHGVHLLPFSLRRGHGWKGAWSLAAW